MTDQEINEAVARKLRIDYSKTTDVECKFCECAPCACGKRHYVDRVNDYCHSIAAAWEVVEYLKKTFIIQLWCSQSGNSMWISEYYIDEKKQPIAISEKNDSIAMAICLAFLKLP